MTADKETLAYYDAHAEEFAAKPLRLAHYETLGRFMNELPAGGAVLDLGCGGGWAASEMARRGFEVEAVDGSPGMVEEARRRTGLDVRVMSFDELDIDQAYDGVFASFSLLHAPRSEAPGLLSRVWRSLRPGGVLFVGVKSCAKGAEERRDALGRLYTDYSRSELDELLGWAGFDVIWSGEGHGVGMDGVKSEHIYLLARRGAPPSAMSEAQDER